MLGVMHYPDLSANTAIAELRHAGLQLELGELRIDARGERWAVQLPGGLMAWFPRSATGLHQLTCERRLLALLSDRCSFAVPRVLYASARGFDVRAMVLGDTDPWGVYRRLAQDAGLASRIGRSLGTILAEQHTRVVHEDIRDWLPEHVRWPEPAAWVRERIASVVDDPKLCTRIDGVLAAYESVEVDEHDRVLVHTDLGLHNLAFAPETMDVRGVFDYEDAAWADRHFDFRYLVFDFDGDQLLDAALAVYEPAVGQRLSRERILLYNAVCAFCHLAYRRGTRPEDKSCGRTLAEDLRWTQHALGRLRTEG
jgi:hypothetical protein